MEFDRLERRILARLQLDGRLAVVELAESIGLSPRPARAHQGAGTSGAIRGLCRILIPPYRTRRTCHRAGQLTEHTDETSRDSNEKILLIG